jgi:GTP-binding protein
MKLEQIEFICSSPSLKFCPMEDLPEFAFIGRSNVGKSSLINMLAARKGLAKVSGTPGKTRLINHFKVTSTVGSRQPAVNSPQSAASSPQSAAGSHPASRIMHPASFSWFLVDLPGFGFAKLAKTEREKFEEMIRNYLVKRETLALTFLLIDSRLAPQKIDLEFMNWLGDREIGFIILFTKTDKLSKTQLAASIAAYRKALSESWEETPRIIATSAATKYGRDEVLDTIGDVLLEVSSPGVSH